MNIRLKIIIIAVGILLAIYFWPSALGGNTEILIVQGHSMLPTILPGSLVIAKQAPEYHIDDIVAYIQRSGAGSQKIVVHRIVDETENGFVLLGDNNPTRDPGFPQPEDILGKVIFSTPYVGDILALLRNPVLLVMAAGVIGAIQMVQKRQKEKKERLRRIRLGLPKYEKPAEKAPKKPKKPDYTLFFAAIAINVIVYVTVLFIASSGTRPEGDILTGFLYRSLVPSFVATITFALYFVFIIGMYFLSKMYEAKSYRKSEIPGRKSKSGLGLLLGKESNPMLAVASFLWLLFIVMELFHLMAIANELATIIN